jgi:hypothetical protein
MPVVASFEGIKIQFYWDEHPPPHFHAEYAEYRAQIDIETLRVLRGGLPASQLRKVRAWAESRKRQLRQAWFQCLDDGLPSKVE